MAVQGECVCTGAPLPAHTSACDDHWLALEETEGGYHRRDVCECNHRRPQVLRSANGFCIGYLDEDMSVYSRESRDYWDTFEEAHGQLFEKGWFDRAGEWHYPSTGVQWL